MAVLRPCWQRQSGSQGILSVKPPPTSLTRTSRDLFVKVGSRISGRSGRALSAVLDTPAASAATLVDGYVASLLESLDQPPVPQTGAAFDLIRDLRSLSISGAASQRWPSRKDEAFRFTDLKPLQGFQLEVRTGGPTQIVGLDVDAVKLDEVSSRIFLVDGVWSPDLSDVSTLPPGAFISPLSRLQDDAIREIVGLHVGRLSAKLDLFSDLNGAAAPDVLVVYVPPESRLSGTVHVIHATSAAAEEGAVRVASPRLLLVAGAGSELELVEEFVGCGQGAGSYWVNAVAEVVVAKGARVLHGVLQQQRREAFHLKTTAVQQEEGSEYSLVEAELGARLSRHNLRMRQQGPDTTTHLSTFCLAGGRQLHDLHSSLVLDFPRGVTRQLHKCIVTDSSGQGVFDGNVQVNRFAQQTDAGQLTRSLLLAPRGTVNVKPNLQIVADDVKCTHGAAISDLDDEQLFYFQARGINEQTARSALVFSFAAEIVERFPYAALRRRVEKEVKEALSSQGAMDATVATKLQSADS